MKVDIAKLINEVSKHPEIYNPDHKDFSNKEIRNNIFNTIINKDMNGIKGEILQRKWDQILDKYANFIRKLSNDDSSERVLERFMKWPWTKPMRIFKPYVRKQFQIPEFQSATQLTPYTDTDMPPISVSALQPLITIPIINGLSGDDATSGSEFQLPTPTGQGPVQGNGTAGQEPVAQYAHTLPTPTTYEGLSNANETPATPRPAVTQLTHPIPEPSLEIPQASTVEIVEIPIMSNIGFMGTQFMRTMPRLPVFLQENLNRTRRSQLSSPRSSTDDDDGYRLGRSITAAMIQDIQRMISIDRFPDNVEDNDDDEEEDEEDDEDEEEEDDDDDDDNAGDDESATDEEAMSTVDDGPSRAKKRRRQDQSGENSDKGEKSCTGANDDTSHTGDDDDDCQSDVLPDLPQPKPAVKRGSSDFSAQEHIFLAWAKTMSTFTAKRQATIKMQINKIMSEAEFEDLDDEFFAANRKPRRSIYTSRY